MWVYVEIMLVNLDVMMLDQDLSTDELGVAVLLRATIKKGTGTIKL